MKAVKVLYHRADFDGLFSYAIAKRFWGSIAEYEGWDYMDPIPSIGKDQRVYMIDITIDPLMQHPNLFCIDHHKTAIEKYSSTVEGTWLEGVSACRLAYQTMFGDEYASKEDYIERRVKEPLPVRLAGEYDIMDRRDPRVLLFQYGLKSITIDDELWMTLTDVAPEGGVPNKTVCAMDRILERGRIIQETKELEDASLIKDYGFTVDFEGKKFLAVNNGRYNSLLFREGIKPEHDGVLGFNWTGNAWKVSMYAIPGKDYDFSTIARRWGGGGHPQACGFITRTLPFMEA